MDYNFTDSKILDRIITHVADQDAMMEGSIKIDFRTPLSDEHFSPFVGLVQKLAEYRDHLKFTDCIIVVGEYC